MLPSRAKLQYILFDWDGTLADNAAVVLQSVNQVLDEYDLPDWEQMKHRRDPRLSLWDNFANLFGREAEAAYERYLQIYKAATPAMVKAFPGAVKALEFLKDDSREVMIMTNKDRRLLDIELPLLYNPDIFSRIVCGHEAPRDKPYPEHIFYTLRGLLTPAEITPENVWMVGDSDQDSDCALAAGALPIRVNQALFGNGGYVSDNVKYFKDFGELLAALQKEQPDV